MKKAVVIGAGIGGIAIALRLRAKNFHVTIIEKSEKPGGKLDEFYWNGFRWDMGPSLFTLPYLVNELFELFPKESSIKFDYDKLNIVCKYFFPDGMVIDAYNSSDKFAHEVENKTGVDKEVVIKYLKKSEDIYKLTAPVFIFNTFHKLSWTRIKNGLKALMKFHKLQAFKTMHKSNEELLKEKHLVQLFDRFATYNGSDPYKAPATLNVIPYLEHCLGAFFPKKGMYSIIESLVNLAMRKGVVFKLNEEVLKINHQTGAVRSVSTTNNDYECDIAVSDSDIIPFYKLFSPEINISQRFVKHERSSSALIFYWAIDKKFEQLDLHNIFFSNDYKSEFSHLFESKNLFNDPTVYVFISSKRVNSDAPSGKENWFVMVNVPTNEGQDWDMFIKNARKAILKKLSHSLDCNIEKLILNEDILDPRKIESKTSSYQGSLYGASSNSKWSAFQRHSNFSNKVKGMYFVGGSVHPGGGIPLCLSSAKIVSELIDETEQ